jgi:AcrR family transcriptional regulator
METVETNKKYIAIIDTAKALFWKHGFRRVTIEEICREANSSKMTFYRFFPNKLELAKTILDNLYGMSMIKFREVTLEDSTPEEKMRKMLSLKLEGTNNISQEFLQDFYNNPELELKDYIAEKSKSALAEIIDIYRDGQKNGWIRKDLNIEFLVYFIQKATPLITDEELLKSYNSPQDLVMDLTNLLVYGILPKK